MIYLLNAVVLTPGGSITVQIYTQTVHKTTHLTTLIERVSGIRTQIGQTNWEYNINIKTNKMQQYADIYLLQSHSTCFDVLLTVHLSIFISVINQLDAQNLFHNKFYFMLVSSHLYRCDDTRGCVMQF